MFEWCSISVSDDAGRRAPTFARPHAYATRLIASVALRVKIVSPGVEPANAATRSRAPSKALGRLGGERVDAAVDARAVAPCSSASIASITGARRLRRRGRVEVDEALPREDRELGATR